MKKIKVANLELVDGHPKICVPIVGEKHEDVLQQAKQVVAMKPDLVEWRCDLFESIYIEEIENMLIDLREIIGDIPLVFTFRTDGEGGEKYISNDNYYDLNTEIAKSGLVDFVDVEAYTKDSIALDMIEEIHMAGAKVIGSNHHFEDTPSKEDVVDILMKIEELGADICKLAVMPSTVTDVENFIEASKEANDRMLAPIITMAMGELGKITRVCGKTTGSVITFASGTDISAPGQMPIEVVRKIIEFDVGSLKKSNIYLIGFMGTGKTTVSKQLGLITCMEVIDVDEKIVEDCECEIKEIFAEHGEEYFRKKETEELKDIHKMSGKIISCGGGIVLKDENINIMQKGKVVLLTATPETVYERVSKNGDRPVLNDNMSVEHITELLDGRSDRYNKAAQIVIPTDERTVLQICTDIIDNL